MMVGRYRDTTKLLPKLVSVAAPTAALRTRWGKISPTSSQAIGPKETWYAPTYMNTATTDAVAVIGAFAASPAASVAEHAPRTAVASVMTPTPPSNRGRLPRVSTYFTANPVMISLNKPRITLTPAPWSESYPAASNTCSA